MREVAAQAASLCCSADNLHYDNYPPLGKGFFLVLRFYGPLEGYIEKTWVLNDLELIK